MIDDVMNIVGLEFVKDRNDDGSVCDGGQESNAPMRTVATADGYFWFPNGSLVKSTYNPKGDDYEQIS